MRKWLALLLSVGGLLAVLFLGSRSAQSQSSCNSQGIIVQFYTMCECTGSDILVSECQGIAGPRCDPLADFIFCGSHCAIGVASDNCGGSASRAIQLRLPQPPALAGPHPCLDNSALGIWLEARMSQRNAASKSSLSVGSM